MDSNPSHEHTAGHDERYLDLLRRHPELVYQAVPGGLRHLLSDADRREAESAACSRASGESLDPSAFRTGVIAEDPYICLLRDAVRFPGGQLGTYLRILEKPLGRPGVAVLPMLGDHVVLLKHFRHATGRAHWEIPRGFASDGESWQDTARREIREELGAGVRGLSKLGTLHPNTGLLAGESVLALARIDEIGDLDRAEGIVDHRVICSEDAARMCRDGDITDAFTLAAMLHTKFSGLL